MRFKSNCLLTGVLLLLCSCQSTEEKVAAAFEERYQETLIWGESPESEPQDPGGPFVMFAATERYPDKNFSITYDVEADTLIDDSYLSIAYEAQFREEFGVQHTGFPYLDVAFLKVRGKSSDPGNFGPWVPDPLFRDGFAFSSAVDFEKDLSTYRKNHDDLAVALRFYMGMSDLAEDKLEIVKILLDRFEESGLAWTKMDVVFFDDAFLGGINMHQPRMDELDKLRYTFGKKEIHILPHPDLPNPSPAEMLKYIDPGNEVDCFFAESHDIYSDALGFGDVPVEDPVKTLEDLVAQYDPRFEGGVFWGWGYTLRAATDLVEHYLKSGNKEKAQYYLDILYETGEAREWWSNEELSEIQDALADE